MTRLRARRVVQDVRRLDHLHHEGALPGRQVVLRADAGEDAIHQPDARRLRRDERADLRQQRNQRDLPQVGRFARHIRPGQQQDLRVAGGKLGIVGDEGDLALARLHDGMASGDDVDGVALVQLGTAVVLARGDLRQRQQDVKLGQDARRPQGRLAPARRDLAP